MIFMMEDIYEQYKKAGELHGHYCPGFAIDGVRFPLPEVPGRRPEMRCSVCGEATSEDKLRIRGGKPICLDCAGLL